jgi:hypothetical protein
VKHILRSKGIFFQFTSESVPYVVAPDVERRRGDELKLATFVFDVESRRSESAASGVTNLYTATEMRLRPLAIGERGASSHPRHTTPDTAS